MKKALITIIIGLVLQGIGVIFDLLDHLTRVFPRGFEAFILAPAHDLVGLGMIISLIGTINAYRALK